MGKIQLTEQEQKWYNELQDLVSHSYEFYNKNISDSLEATQDERDKKMGRIAHRLHSSLTKRGNEPVHYQYMYKNRGADANKQAFYQHVHPVEDLLKFIDGTDPERARRDTTMNTTFEFPIYTRRRGHYDHNKLTRTPNGWDIQRRSTYDESRADKSGKNAVFEVLEAEAVSYPNAIGDLLAWVWEKASEGATKDEVQEALSAIAEWISVCEKATPGGNLFGGLL